MEMRKGYQQTEVGVIPDEWEVVRIGDLHPFVTSGSRGWAAYYSNLGAPFVRITNLSRKSIYLDTNDLKYVNLPPEAREGIRTQLQNQDVLISITADIGIIGYVTQDLQQPAYINQHIALVRFDLTEVDSKFISYFLASKNPQKLFLSMTDLGAKAGMSLITVQKIQLALPSLPEQHRIAAALCDMDTLITALDDLIAKKRLIKQAAMQELLTAKKRLPGFGGIWDVKKLGDVIKITKGQLITEKDTIPGNIPVIAGGKLPAYYHNKPNRMGKTITISASGANAGYVAFYDVPIFASDCSTIEEGSDYSIVFVYQLLLLTIPSPFMDWCRAEIQDE